jgi:hypothetical protein
MIKTHVKQELGRAKNAIQDYLARKLFIPKIYLDADWNGVSVPIDVLAIDRAGVGDVHAVWMAYVHPEIPLKITSSLLNNKLVETVEGLSSLSCDLESALPDLVEQAKAAPLHFRYVAIVSTNPELQKINPNPELILNSFAEDGVGRVGILHVDLSEKEPSVRSILKPERFRSSKEIVALADHYVTANTANWEVRE